MTTGELADLFCRYWGGRASWRSEPDGGPHEANFLKLDCSKVKSVFGWKPRFHLEEAVAMTVEWYRAYLDGADMESVTDEQIEHFFRGDRDGE